MLSSMVSSAMWDGRPGPRSVRGLRAVVWRVGQAKLGQAVIVRADPVRAALVVAKLVRAALVVAKLVVAALVVAGGLVAPTPALALALAQPPSPPRAAGTPARACTSTPAPATTIADTPWPQQRYDLAALSQINDGVGMTVAVLDSGIDATHPQLAAAALAGDDILHPGGNAQQDCIGHGTAVASIIAARPAAGSGLRGLAPGARILPIRVSERAQSNGVVSGEGNVAELAAGITRAVAHTPKPAVINLSIATTSDSPALRGAVQAALDADIVVVAAAGNQHDRGDPAPYPASYPGVIGVGAIGPDGTRLAGSQVGPYVDIVAPGDQIVAATPGGGHATFQGTSFATPFVSATAALIRARWPALHRPEVERRLLATADPAAGARPSPDYGFGVLNPMRALTEVVPPPVQADAPVGQPATVGGQPATPTDQPARSRAVAVTAILILLAAAVAAFAAAVPIGRRRGWRPGRVNEP